MKLHVIIQAQHVFRGLAGLQNPPLQVVDLLAARRRRATDDDLGPGCLVVTTDELTQHWKCRIWIKHMLKISSLLLRSKSE